MNIDHQDKENRAIDQDSIAMKRETYLELKALVDFYANECEHNGPRLNFEMVQRLRRRMEAEVTL